MNISIEKLKSEEYSLWDNFLKSSPHSLFFSSSKYKNLLENFLGIEGNYLIAKNDNGKVVGGLPFFVKHSDIGAVVNSLPFYGSNGGIIEFEGNNNVKSLLYKTFQSELLKIKVLSTTLISSPFEKDLSYYTNKVKYVFTEKRIGQITTLPAKGENLNEELMAIFHHKTRNMVRKCLKSEIKIVSEFNDKVLNFLIKVHKENMEAINGIHKPDDFFLKIPKVFEYESDFKIYTAYLNSKPVAALLVFYFNNTVEYFTPVIKSEYRNLQPMSGLIFKAMTDAVNKNYKYWNFGGTWLTQEGVYRFKKRWGAKDLEYKYFINVLDKSIYETNKKELLEKFSYFFTLPFDQLKK